MEVLALFFNLPLEHLSDHLTLLVTPVVCIQLTKATIPPQEHCPGARNL